MTETSPSDSATTPAGPPQIGYDSIVHGRRGPDGAEVWIDAEPLDWQSTLHVRNHSPTGVEWGYAGSGPSQLALAVLLAVTDHDTAVANYQDFKRAFIVDLSDDTWIIPVKAILEWLHAQPETPAGRYHRP